MIVGCQIPHTYAFAVGEMQPPRALDVKKEALQIILQPGDFQAPLFQYSLPVYLFAGEFAPGIRGQRRLGLSAGSGRMAYEPYVFGMARNRVQGIFVLRRSNPAGLNHWRVIAGEKNSFLFSHAPTVEIKLFL